MTKNLTHSVQERLRAVARQTGREYQATLLLYAQERWLARLAVSSVREQFALKGGLLLYSRYRQAARPTQDMDFAGRSTSSEVGDVLELMQLVTRIDLDDGLSFGADGMTGRTIAQDTTIPGVRLRCEARLGQIRLPLTLDIGFGDALLPAPVLQTFPTLLTLPGAESFECYAVSLETVVAEKFQAMIVLGERNTRLKDFYDLWRIASSEPLAASRFRLALDATFTRRNTTFAAAELFLAQPFAADGNRQQLWQAYLTRTRLAAPVSFAEVMTLLRAFLEPVVSGEAQGHWHFTQRAWLPQF